MILSIAYIIHNMQEFNAHTCTSFHTAVNEFLLLIIHYHRMQYVYTHIRQVESSNRHLFHHKHKIKKTQPVQFII